MIGRSIRTGTRLIALIAALNAMHSGILPAIEGSRGADGRMLAAALAQPGPTASAIPATPDPGSPTPPPATAAATRWTLHVPVAQNKAGRADAPAPTRPSPPPSPSPTAVTSPGVVTTRTGPVAGALDAGAWRFLGIPYAAPPIGDRRWRAPVPPAPWTESLETVSFGPACPQYDAGGVLVGEEDCLTLNVWTPREAPGGDAPRPVLFFLHGGGHEQGASSTLFGDAPLYDGRSFAAEHGTVVVTVNYRLGPFGFLAHPALTAEGGAQASGNYGAHDQLAALRWVHDNIAAFGGDPERVTVFGQSAGAVSACRLAASPLAAGLLHGAAFMSGACVATPLERAEANGIAVAGDLGCTAADDVTACLRGKPADQVMATLDPMGDGTNSLGRMTYDGVVDGTLLPDAPRALIAARRHNAVPAIIGSTTAENGRNAPRIGTPEEYEAAVRAYVQRSGLPAAVAERALLAYPMADYASPRAAYVALTSDVKFVCQARTDARLLAANQDAPTFRYAFDHVADNGAAQARAAGAAHGLDLPYLFGVLSFAVGPIRYRPGPGDLAVSAAMQGYWARFAATGDPNGDGAVAWPAYRSDDDPHVVLASPVRAETGHRTAQCDFWDSLAGR